MCFVFFFKQKTAYEIYQCDWSSDVCSSDLKKDYENKKFIIHPKIKKTGDLGYLGTKMKVPIKKKKGMKLTKEEKLINRQLSSTRVVVEHSIGKMKIFKVLSERFRNPLRSHNLIFKNIAGIHNLMFT